MSYKPSIPKGTRDFSPDVVNKRSMIFNTIRSVYDLYGYQPLETPAMELMETLTGKYGAEGDKLLFKILNSGDFLDGTNRDDLPDITSQKLSPLIAEKGLRYDLTVPFARYVVQHRNEITLPFKRYQIQPVWRADRPQKGRYREFYQCDADVIGSTSLTNELELIQIIDAVFSRLGIKVTIRLNNRKVLMGLAEAVGLGDRFTGFTIALDKLDKVGLEAVINELRALGIHPDKEVLLISLLQSGDKPDQLISKLRELFHGSESGRLGLEEMEKLFSLLDTVTPGNAVEPDITLARGLNYYTGTIIEVVARDLQFGSLCGGGRYDDLTGIFGMPGLSGVGISFGADRIFDVMQELHLFPEGQIDGPKVLFVNFGGADELYSLKALEYLRSHGIPSEMYPEAAKLKKQIAYADARKIPYAVLAGETEREMGTYTIKNMHNSTQQSVTLDQLAELLRK
ncbi:MAG TPA: histidine--tRNA ligase [Bacteroidales bacterium]|nr:histidine--tRNA ligase [Bacteroidales bacterium]HRZ50021.1 histidine--tRNA ligase [Bacteroidales bacterium]